MKHVFMMHSAITYLASLSVISAEKLREEDCVFIYESTNRGFPEFVKSIYLGNFNFSNWGYTNRIDKIITEAVDGNEFIAYIGSMNSRARIIVSNKCCIGFNFIEEGNAAYYSAYDFNLFMNEFPSVPDRIKNVKEGLRHFLLYLKMSLTLTPLKLLRLPINYVNYAHVDGVTFYCLNKYTFPLASVRKEIPVGGSYLGKIPRKYTLDNSFVWVSSKLFEAYPNEKNNLLQVMVNTFVELKKLHSIDNIFIKYHQYESDISRNATIEVFKKAGISYTIMDDSAIMEIELSQANNVTVIGDLSSLLFYNVLFNNKSISIIDSIVKKVNIKETDYNMMVKETFKGVQFI